MFHQEYQCFAGGGTARWPTLQFHLQGATDWIEPAQEEPTAVGAEYVVQFVDSGLHLGES